MNRKRVFNRNFLLIVIGQASSLIGTVLLKFTVSLLILDLTGSAALFGTITAISYLPPIFLAPLGGILADRLNKRNLMVGLDGTYCVTALLLAASMLLDNVLVPITVIMVVLSIVSSFETPVVQSSIPLIQPKDSLVQSNAVVNQVNMVANLTGPLLAGMLYSFIKNVEGVKIIFICCAVCFFFAALLEAFIKIPVVAVYKVDGVVATVKHDLGEGVRFITRERPHVYRAIVLNASFVLLIQPLITVGAPYIIRVMLGLSSVLNGVSQALMGAAGLTGGILAGLLAKRFLTRNIYKLFWIMGLAMALLSGAFIVALPALGVYGMLSLCGVIIFVAASFAGVFIMSAIQNNVPEHMLGRVMSFYGTLMSAALPVGMVLYGYLYERFTKNLFIILVSTAIAIIAVGWVGKPTYRRLEKTSFQCPNES